MMATSKIEWTDTTWNPVVGCRKVSPGCTHCYAERMAGRLKAMGRPGYQDAVDDKGRWTGRVSLLYERLFQPLTWRRPRRVFVNSMSDLFHPDVPFEFVDDVFDVMARNCLASNRHIFQILTKRPDRMHQYFRQGKNYYGDHIPLPNVWLGVSVENQEAADERIPLLLQTPAAVRFLSCEPLLGPVDLGRRVIPPGQSWAREVELAWGDTEELDWVIVGGESGPGARPMHPDWARSIRDQCVAASVPFFFKQHGEWSKVATPLVYGINAEGVIYLLPDGSKGTQKDWYNGLATPMERIGKKAAGRLLDGVEWNQFPEQVNQ
jgi:protein gp37